MQIQYLFEVKKQALHFPTPRVQTQGIAERQALGLYDVGPHLSHLSRPVRHLSQRKVWVGISLLPLTSISVSQAVPPAI